MKGSWGVVRTPTIHEMLKRTFRLLGITELYDILHYTVTTHARIGRF